MPDELDTARDPAVEAPEPSPEAVDAVVRAIAAKEAAGTPGAPRLDPGTAGSPPAHPRPVVVVSGPPNARRPAAGAGTSVSPPAAERRAANRHPATRSGPARPVVRNPIAGLVGRVEWDRLVADESERQRRYGRPSAIVLLELAGLDRATAQTGPGVIDRVVPPCGETLVAMARASDRVTRLRDGRFGILLREADADGASRYAARAVAACDPWLAALPWPLHLVAGWASPDVGDDLTHAVREAERRLETAAGPARGA